MAKRTRNSGAPWWRRVTLRETIVFTLPPMALLVWLFCSSVLDYHRIRQFDDWWSNATSVRKFGWYRVRTMLRSLEMNEVAKRLSPEREDVPQLRLLVKRSDFDRIDSDVGGHWGEWIDVQIEDAGRLDAAELRFRGDGSAHWTSEKKSFTLKTKSGSLYKGFRTLAFSVKDVLPQWLVGTLAKDFGLLAPEQQLVPVFLNNRFYGLHRFVEPIDESFLRRNVKLPGNVFRADTAERGDYFKGLPREVFRNPFIWDRAANNDRPGAFGTSLLGQWIADLNTSTFEEHEKFMSWMDRDELSRLLAFELVCGDPYHMSGVHNQFWYEDPSSGKLHPVVWDVRLLELGKPPPGSNINRFWRAALKDPRVWDGALREVAKQLEGDKLYKAAEERVNGAWARYRDEFEYDTLRSGIIPPVGDPGTTLATLRKNLDTLKGWLADARVRARSSGPDDAGRFVIDVVVEGRAPCELSRIQALEVKDDLLFDKLHRDSNENGVLDAGDGEVKLAHYVGKVAACDVPLLSAIDPVGSELRPAPRHYRFFFDATTDSEIAKALGLEFVNAFTRQPVQAAALADGTPLPSASGWSHWRCQPKTHGVVTLNGGEALQSGSLLDETGVQRVDHDTRLVFSGDLRLDKDLVVDERGLLRIEPGTTLTLDPDVSILIKGKAEFLGTEEQPITIQRSNPELPWGVIALQGSRASSSRFEHVRFLGGGGASLEHVEYTGQICVHNAFDVVFDHCEIAGNSRCDDMLHVDKGQADITYCWFHDANGDSIDYDMSGGLVAYNRIEGSGNDGLDLMTCWPRVVGNTIVGSADKGISIGECSTPLVFENTIERCERGIEAKDRSAPLVIQTSITGCKRGIYAHLKNWRYGEAGWPKVVGSLVRDNESDLVFEDGGRITLESSFIGATGDVVPPLGDYEWLLRENGLVAGARQPGPGGSFDLTTPLAPLHAQQFAEDFVDPRDGWLPGEGVTRLCKREHDLVAYVGRTRGRFGRTLDWNLSDASRTYVLVLEIAGEAVSDVRAALRGSLGVVEKPLALAPQPTTYRYATVALPPDRYESLVLFATPEAPPAKLHLHSWRVLGWPREGGK